MTNFPRCDLVPAMSCCSGEKRRLENPNRMYAIVRTGGRQYRGEPGKVIDGEKLAVDEGSTITLEVLLVSPDSGDPVIGTPVVDGVGGRATVGEHLRAKEKLYWKYRPGLP